MTPAAAYSAKTVVRKRQTTLEDGPKVLGALHPKPFDVQDQLQKKVDAQIVNKTYQKRLVDIERHLTPGAVLVASTHSLQIVGRGQLKK